MELPFITTVWDLQHRLQPYFPEVGTQEQWNKREEFYTTLLKRASFIIAGTEAGKSEIERFYQVPAERIKLLPLPTPQFALNAPRYQEENFLEKYNIPENYLFYPAQFWSHKNHVNLLLAVKSLRDKYDLVFPVVFVGSDKGNQPYIKQLVAELDLTEHVTFLGFVPQEDLISLYRNAFALTFVSFFGPDNLPPLEAFALGCPVVYSEVSGAKEQIGDAALLVNPKKPEEIALAIKSLWDDKALRQIFVERGLARASEWTGEDYVKGVFSILDEFEAIRRCWTS
jgi:glycosyltransferase involved in cell wall biosynthesis